MHICCRSSAGARRTARRRSAPRAAQRTARGARRTALRAEGEAQRLLLAARSEALCTRVAGELGAELGAYGRAPPPAEGHAVALPALLRRVLGEYDAAAAEVEALPVVGDQIT